MSPPISDFARGDELQILIRRKFASPLRRFPASCPLQCRIRQPITMTRSVAARSRMALRDLIACAGS
jgi:hypothetical protein